jgi:hypothetical protein
MGSGLEQLDERLREVGESIASIKTSLQVLEGTVGMMNKALFQGNGKPSLMTRVEMLEQAQIGFAAQCKDCKAIILTSSNRREDAAEAVAQTENRRTLIVIERWKAITAIVTALVASPVLISIVAALLNK